MNEIIVDVSFEQTRVALLENEELNEVYIERYGSKRNVGSIYKGRVENVLPGMQAAFVNIGLEKNAFLYVKDAFVGYENVYPAAGIAKTISTGLTTMSTPFILANLIAPPPSLCTYQP